MAWVIRGVRLDGLKRHGCCPSERSSGGRLKLKKSVRRWSRLLSSLLNRRPLRVRLQPRLPQLQVAAIA